jgi:putative membrane protein
MARRLKPLLLISLGLFLYARLYDGSILFYINQRFVWLIWAAVVVFAIVIVSYRITRHASEHAHADHSHGLKWYTVAILLLPVLLGWLVPAKPLGSSALANRELNVSLETALNFSLGTVRQAVEERDLTILDWITTFQLDADDSTFAGQTADLTGFVHRRANLPPDTWLLSRFVVTCCVADAMPVGLMVRAPGFTPPEDDQWVQVTGQLAVEINDGQRVPVLLADSLTEIPMPQLPYLYPR